MEGNRNEEQEKGAEIRAILSFRDRSDVWYGGYLQCRCDCLVEGISLS